MITSSDIVYISGQMSGLPDYNYAVFNEAEHYLVNTFGCTVINPARHVQCENLSRDYYMELAKIDVKHCDVIVFIEGEYHRDGKLVKHSWQTSKGALQEFAWACDFGKKIIEMKELKKNEEQGA
jgi:hypothetical protein